MPETIDLEGVKRLVSEGAQVLDVMSRAEYEDSHLPGTNHITLKELDEQAVSQLDGSRPVITYCSDHQ
jgi:rhodanese-related sulfurtransferase